MLPDSGNQDDSHGLNYSRLIVRRSLLAINGDNKAVLQKVFPFGYYRASGRGQNGYLKVRYSSIQQFNQIANQVEANLKKLFLHLGILCDIEVKGTITHRGTSGRLLLSQAMKRYGTVGHAFCAAGDAQALRTVNFAPHGVFLGTACKKGILYAEDVHCPVDGSGTQYAQRGNRKAQGRDATACETRTRVDWQMKIDDARCKLDSVYPKIELWHGTGRH